MERKQTTQVQTKQKQNKHTQKQIKQKKTKQAHTKTKGTSAQKMVKTPAKKPALHATVPKKGRPVFKHAEIDAKKKCSELQDNYEKNMNQATMHMMRARIDDTLSSIVRFMRATSLKVQDVNELYVPSCRNLRANFLQMVKGGGKVFPMPNTLDLLCGKNKSRISIINVTRLEHCVVGGASCYVPSKKTSRLHCFVLIDREKHRIYVVDAGSKVGTRVQQGAFTAHLCLKDSVQNLRIAVLKHETFYVTVGGGFIIRFKENEDIPKPFVPNIGLQSLRPRKKD